jgi:UDP-glucose 4-epimerase
MGTGATTTGVTKTVNLGTGCGYSVLEMIRAFEKASGRQVPYEIVPRRPGDPATIIANADRIRAELGWKPEHDNLEEIVAAALRWEKSLAGKNI